jgi:hypothetical protein
MTEPFAPIGRRLFLGALGAAALTPWRFLRAESGPTIEVFKSPTCGCCRLWVEHLQASGFAVKVEDVADLSQVKAIAGVPGHLAACHTALVEGYVVEGHAPALAIQRLLDERPEAQGIAVPGMPAGSPGMPDANPERYDVILFDAKEERVFMSFVETEPV